jgi:hypothetical protein
MGDNMDNFKFRSGKKTLNIEDKEYTLDIGNKEQLKAWLAKIGELDKLAKSMDVESESVVDDLVKLEKEIVDATVGDWERLWALAEENVFAMLDLVRMLSGVLKESVSDRMKAYGL